MSQATRGSSGSGASAFHAAKTSRCVQWAASSGQWTQETQAAVRSDAATRLPAATRAERRSTASGESDEREGGEQRDRRAGVEGGARPGAARIVGEEGREEAGLARQRPAGGGERGHAEEACRRVAPESLVEEPVDEERREHEQGRDQREHVVWIPGGGEAHEQVAGGDPEPAEEREPGPRVRGPSAGAKRLAEPSRKRGHPREGPHREPAQVREPPTTGRRHVCAGADPPQVVVQPEALQEGPARVVADRPRGHDRVPGNRDGQERERADARAPAGEAVASRR